MFSTSIMAVALAGAASAMTPTGFEPASSNNMTLAFGNTLAINGRELQKAEVAMAPTLGTSEKLFGTYTVMMVDPDVPTSSGGSTSELLHWMQAGLVSSNTSTTVAGVTTYQLVNAQNISAIAAYMSPSPPNKIPNTHRYTQLLLNTTGNSSAMLALARAGMKRTNFSAVDVVANSGVQIVAGNSFNVSNSTSSALTQSNITKTTQSGGSSGAAKTTAGSTSAGPTPVSIAGTGSGPAAAATNPANSTNSNSTAASAMSTAKAGAVELKRDGALIAGLGAFAAAIAML